MVVRSRLAVTFGLDPRAVVPDLALDGLGRPAKFGAHQFSRVLGHLDPTVPRFHRKAGASGEYVIKMQSAFAAHRVNNFGAQVGQTLSQWLAQVGSGGDQVKHGVDLVTVTVQQMRC